MNQGKYVIICRCEEVTEEEVRQAIRDGARDVDAVKRMTRAGMGLCQGHTCYKLVAQIIGEMTGRPMHEVIPATLRPPLRALAVRVLGKSYK